jgi:superfamily II DNA or RNA helicase
MELFDYQKRIKAKTYGGLRLYNAIICYAPTGAGKTVMFSDIISDGIKAGKKVMVLVNRVELIYQTENTLKSFGIQPKLIIPNKGQGVADIYVASVQTLRNRDFPNINLLIVDECHLTDFDPVVAKYKEIGVKVIGFTATPLRLSKKKPLLGVYEHIVQEVSIKELIEINQNNPKQGLVEPIYYEAHSGNEDIKTDYKTGDYSDREQFEYYNKTELYAGVVDSYNKLLKGKKTIVFCINVKHSENTARQFNDSGIRAISLDGATNKNERKRAIEAFEKGEYDVLCNCNLFTYGFDVKSILGVILYRQTKSLALYLQMIGRGARPYPNKHTFTVIDHGGNIKRLGFWHEDKIYSLKQEKEKEGGVAPVKDCPELKGGCGALLHLSATQCKFCGFVFEKEERQEITEKIEIRQLVDEKLEIKSKYEEIGVNIAQQVIDNYGHLKPRELLQQLYQSTLVANKFHYPTAKNAIFAFAKLKKYNHHWAYKTLSTWQP